jgi:hypothetical protein
MNTKQIPGPHFEGSRGEDGNSPLPDAGPALCVTVIATTEEGTTAALNAARWLATDLDARITLLKKEAAPIRLPLDRPPVSLEFTINQQHSLVRRSSAREKDVEIQIRLCRDCASGLQRLLRRRALVVIGGKRHWWLSGEERLERALRRLGHHVIFIDVGQETDWTSPSNSFPVSPGSGAKQFRKQEGDAKSFWGRKGSQ